MKAWLVREKDEFIATVVFAETRGKARALARWTDACDGVAFCDIKVCRLPKADKYYQKGKCEMEWGNPQDRLVLVKEFGFSCEYAESCDCEECIAKQYCDTYKDLGERP